MNGPIKSIGPLMLLLVYIFCCSTGPILVIWGFGFFGVTGFEGRYI
jgi:hypothetical protein